MTYEGQHEYMSKVFDCQLERYGYFGWDENNLFIFKGNALVSENEQFSNTV